MALILTFSYIFLVYATELFNDGFECPPNTAPNTFTAWTGTSATPPTIVGSPVHHGSYSMLCDAGVRHCYKDVAAQDHLNTRTYIKWSAIPSSALDRIMLIRQSTTQILRVYYHYSEALFPVNKVGFSLYNDVKGDYAGHYDVNIGTADWHCIEIEYQNGVDGYCKLYIDGTERISESYNFGAQQASRVFLIHDHLSAFNVNFDCAVIADTYIGLEEVGQNITETFYENITSTEGLVDQKEKIINYGESASIQTEVTTQTETGITMTETIYQTLITTTTLYTSLDEEAITVLSALTFAVIAFIIAIIAIILILAQKKT